MPTIGYNVIAGASALSQSSWSPEAQTGASYRYTAVTGDSVTEVAVYGDSGGDAQVAVYVWNGSVPTTMVGSPVTVNMAGAAGWKTASTSIALTNGVTYVVGIDYYVTGGYNIRYGGTAGTMLPETHASNALQTTWGAGSAYAGNTSFYATVTAGSGGTFTAAIAATGPIAASALAGTFLAPGTDRTATIAATGPIASSALAGTVVNPTVTYTDDFNRADTVSSASNALGASWNVPANTWHIASNQATKANGDHYTRWVTAMPSTDHYVEAVLRKADLGNFMWLHLRALTSAGGTGVPLGSYEGGLNTTVPTYGGGECEIGRVDPGGGYTVLARGTTVYGSGAATFKLRLEAIGSTIRLLIDDALIISATDSTFAGSYVGLNCFNAGTSGTITYDNFAAGTIAPAVFTATIAATGPRAVSALAGTFVPLSTTRTGTIAATGPRATSSLAGTIGAPPSAGGVIGVNTIGGSTDATASSWQAECLVGPTYRYTAGAGEAVTQFNVYGDGTGDCQMAIYVWNGTVPTTRVGAPVTVPVGATAGWHTAATNIPLTAGVTYVVGLDYYVTDSFNIRYASPGGASTSTTSATDLSATTWSQASVTGDAVSFYATVAAAATITGAIAATGPRATSSLAATFVPSGTTRTATLAATGPRASSVLAATFVGTAPTHRFATNIAGRKIVDQTGAVYLMRTFSSWAMAENLSNPDITEALEGIAARGFNAATICYGGGIGGGEFGGGWHRYTNQAGADFWTGTPWGSSFGPGWSSVDWAVSECNRLGMTICMSIFMSWGTNGARDDLNAVTTTQAYNVGVELATRYLAFDNIVWHVMFDYDPGLNANIDALYHGINDTEGVGRRPVRWCEPNNGSSTYGAVISWGYSHFNITCNGFYSYEANSTEKIEGSWNEAGATTLPTGDVEPLYDGHSSTGQTLRYRSWATILEGGVYANYGHEDWWPFKTPNPFGFSEGLTWQQVPDDVHTVQQSYCWTFVDAFCAVTDWAPSTTFLTAGAGTGADKAAVGASAITAAVYFPTSRSGITVNTSILAGTGNVRLRWFDPVLNSYATIAPNEAQNTSRAVTYPSNHVDGSSDYVLLVELVAGTTGTIAATEGADTAGIAGSVGAPTGIVGTFDVTELADTAAIVGNVGAGPITGTLVATEGSDVAVIVGNIPGAPVSATGPLRVSVTPSPALHITVSQP